MIKVIDSFADVQLSGEVFVVYDAAVAWIAEQIVSSREGILGSVAIDASEQTKTMDTVLLICRSMMEAGLTREGEVVCIGGGITCDAGGFAASIYKRGVSCVNVPTTLLSQVDAGIGGKNGVNFLGYKNMLGTIVQPRATYICADALRTLPPRELRCGLAEMVKTFLIAEAAAYEELCSQGAGSYAAFISKAALIKASIVEEDPFEHGRRSVLNLGHTFAHGIEYVAARRGDDIAHGEAVAMGIILASRLGDRLHGTSLEAEISAGFERLGLPVNCPYSPEELLPAMTKDKKGVGEKLRFVLLEGIGKPVFELLDPSEAVKILSR